MEVYQGSVQNLIRLPLPTLKLIPCLNFSTQAQIAHHIPEALREGKMSQSRLSIWLSNDLQGASSLDMILHSHLDKRATLTSLMGRMPRPLASMERQTWCHLTGALFPFLHVILEEVHDFFERREDVQWCKVESKDFNKVIHLPKVSTSPSKTQAACLT